jgi:hypothetical protein
MTTDRRTFLKHAAATVAVTAVAGCAPRASTAHALDQRALSALGDTVLPESLGPDGRASVVRAFFGWITAYHPVSEQMHGYGDAEITYTPADPAPGWNAQLSALDLLATRKHGRLFADLDAAGRRAIATSQLARMRGDRLPGNPLAAPHVALALLAFWASSPEATDLAYGARIAKGTCRTLAESPRKPLPLAPPGKS